MTRRMVVTMSKHPAVTFTLLALLALGFSSSARAGVDQMLLGGDELGADFSAGDRLTLRNESTLYDAGRPLHRPVRDPGLSNSPGGHTEVSLQGNVPSGGGTASAPVAEPGTGLLLGVGVLGLARGLRRRAV